jgi:hypothetical protein
MHAIMKPKPIFRLVCLLLVTTLSIFLFTSSKTARLAQAPVPVENNYIQAVNEKASSNEFIFFESITRYLLVSLPK